MRLYLTLIFVFALAAPASAQSDRFSFASTSSESARQQQITKIRITPATKELNQAFYYMVVRERLDRIINANHPSEAGKPLYGKVLLWLPLDVDGTIFEAEGGPRIEQSSGNAALDRRVISMIREAAPFARAQHIDPRLAKGVVNELLVRLDFLSPEERTRRHSETLDEIAARAPIVDSLPMLYLPYLAYPESARRNGEEGTVVIRALVSESGSVKVVKLERSSGVASLDQAAAVATWKLQFNPYLENWAPQAAWVKIPYTFASTESTVRIGNENAARLPLPSGVKMTMSDTRTIGEKIRSNTMYNVPADLTSNNPVEYSVSLDSGGFVKAIDMLKSSGLPDFDAAVRRAIERSAPYPADANGVMPQKFILSHRPREVKSGY